MSRSESTSPHPDPHLDATAARLEAAIAAFDGDHDLAHAWRRVAHCIDVRDLARRLGGDARAWALVAMQMGRAS